MKKFTFLFLSLLFALTASELTHTLRKMATHLLMGSFCSCFFTLGGTGGSKDGAGWGGGKRHTTASAG